MKMKITDKMVDDAIEAGQMEGWDFIEDRMKDALAAALPHLHPVDVAAVRYDKSDIYLAIENGYDPMSSDEGEYVRYDQAAEIIAEERMKLEATAKTGLKLSEELESVKAELAKIKKETIEKCADVAKKIENVRTQIPCPDGIKGCLVYHVKLGGGSIETAIRSLNEEPS